MARYQSARRKKLPQPTSSHSPEALSPRPFAPSGPAPAEPATDANHQNCTPSDFSVLEPGGQTLPVQTKLSRENSHAATEQTANPVANQTVQRIHAADANASSGAPLPHHNLIQRTPDTAIQRKIGPDATVGTFVKRKFDGKIFRVVSVKQASGSTRYRIRAPEGGKKIFVKQNNKDYAVIDPPTQAAQTNNPLAVTGAVNGAAAGAVPLPRTLPELAATLDTGYLSWKANDDDLWTILRGPLRANWFFAKDCLTNGKWPGDGARPSHAASLALMQALVDMRSRKWKAFADRTTPRIHSEVQRVADTHQQLFGNTQAALRASGGDPLLMGEAVGAQAVTSDIDLALKGNNTEIGVGLINDAFRQDFQVPFDPGTVFDINVYSLDWMHGQTEVTQNPQTNSVATFNPDPESRGQLVAQRDQQARADSLEIWALVKIRRNMTAQQWATYEQQTLQAIANGEARAAMEKKLVEAEFEYQSYHIRLQTKLQAMDQELRQQEAGLGYSTAGATDEYVEEARSMRASNALYQEVVLQVRQIRLRLDQLRAAPYSNPQDIINLSKQLAYKVAEGLTYANEVYATEGAVLHTVYGKQGATKKLAKLQQGDPQNGIAPRPHVQSVQYNLTPEHYLQSMDENVGDSLHALNHYARDPAYAVYRAGKYLERLCEAAGFLLGEDAATMMPYYTELKNIGAQAVTAKNGPVGQDPMAVNTDPFFGNCDVTRIADLRGKILAFGARVSATFHSQQAPQTPLPAGATPVPQTPENPTAGVPGILPPSAVSLPQSLIAAEAILNSENPT